MKEPRNGGAAFPQAMGLGDHGMSLRDWFAGQALAMLRSSEVTSVARSAGKPTPTFVAGLAYELADAMLAERQKAGRS